MFHEESVTVPQEYRCVGVLLAGKDDNTECKWVFAFSPVGKEDKYGNYNFDIPSDYLNQFTVGAKYNLVLVEVKE